MATLFKSRLERKSVNVSPGNPYTCPASRWAMATIRTTTNSAAVVGNTTTGVSSGSGPGLTLVCGPGESITQQGSTTATVNFIVEEFAVASVIS